jgi:LysR family hydrogen peroxide-inducible transcriptional activator
MNIRDLTYLIAVDRHGSITRAAQACDITQPTLSAQIAKLENEFGVPLFERDGRALKVTAAGRTMLEHAKRIVGEVDDMVAAAMEHRDPLGGTLRLGMIPTLAPYFLPSLLPAVRKALPRLALTIVEEQTARLLEHLRDGTLEAAMLATAVDDERFTAIPLFEEPLHVALYANHPLASRDAVTLGEIDPCTLLLLSEGHCLRDQALALCSERALGTKVAGDFRAASLETVLNLVEAGMGITLVPELCLQSARLRTDKLAIRRIDDKGATRAITLVYRTSTPRRLVVSELAKMTRDLANSLFGPLNHDS